MGRTRTHTHTHTSIFERGGPLHNDLDLWRWSPMESRSFFIYFVKGSHCLRSSPKKRTHSQSSQPAGRSLWMLLRTWPAPVLLLLLLQPLLALDPAFAAAAIMATDSAPTSGPRALPPVAATLREEDATVEGAGGVRLAVKVCNRRSPIAVVLAHPYGPLGGSMFVNLISRLTQCLAREGVTTVRFNARGGESFMLSSMPSVVSPSLTRPLSPPPVPSQSPRYVRQCPHPRAVRAGGGSRRRQT